MSREFFLQPIQLLLGDLRVEFHLDLSVNDGILDILVVILALFYNAITNIRIIRSYA